MQGFFFKIFFFGEGGGVMPVITAMQNVVRGREGKEH